MIIFNVAGLLQEPPGATREAVLRDRYVSVGPDIELAGPIDGRIRLQRTNRGIIVRGAVDAPLRRTCSRCLDPYVEAVHVDLVEEFLPTVDPKRGVPLPAPPSDDSALAIDERHQVDLTPVLYDELALTEPMHPLCRPDCPGLCPGCGRRMDVGSCDCVTDELDPRMAALAALLDRPTD